MQFITRFKTIAQQETPAERRQRMLPGAMYGLIIASSYAIIGGIVNQLSFPDLPIGVDWRNILITWLFFAVWLGLGGGFINWFTQTEESMATGLFMMTAIALVAGALTFEGNLPTQFGKIILLALPVVAVSLVMTITLRSLGVRHAEIIEREKTLKTKSFAVLVAVALAIGGVSGFGLNRMDDSTLSGARYLHSQLQIAAADPSQAEALFPLSNVPDLASHLGTSYTMYGHPSGQSVVAVEITTKFKDGYQITCALLVFLDRSPFLRACAEGEKVSLPAQ